MPLRNRAAALLLVLLALRAPGVTAQVSRAEIEGHLRVLASDQYEGRAPGTRGEALTTSYFVSWLTAWGVKPIADGSFLQPVRLSIHDPAPGSVASARLSGRIERELEHGRDVRFYNPSSRARVVGGGELVYVGYAIQSRRNGWDDFAGVDLAGKVAVAEFGEPLIDGDTTRFNGVRASRLGYANNKVAELERRGAVGVLWVRPDRSLSSAPVGGLRQLASQANRPLAFAGLITDSVLATLLPPGAPAIGELRASAARPGFRPVPLGVRFDAAYETIPREIVSHNVAGTIAGTDPRLANEHVILSAHWDHFGIGRPVNGDSIYNGALDDGSGLGVLLALARYFAEHPEPRSITVLFTTAEEWGMLGAEAFVRSGAIPLGNIVANLNMDDGIEFWGPKRDVATLGVEHSTLGQVMASVAKTMGLRQSPDPYPAEGFFLRSDQFPFAQAGVPSLYMALGTDAVGRPAGWVDARVKDYLENHYHRPSDDFDTVVVDLNGSVQYAEYVRDVAIAVARARTRPTWLPDSEFAPE